MLRGVVEISGSGANYYEFVINFNITVVTMKGIEHNFVSRQPVVNEKYKKFVIF